MLNQNSPVPLYRQLADTLRLRIAQGQLPIGARLQSEPQMASHFQIGRPTVRQALDELQRDGLIERRRGSGTFVRERQRAVDIFSLAGTMAAFEQGGVVLTTSLVEPLRRERLVADEAHPFHKCDAYFFSRVGRAEEQPVLFEELWLDPEIFPRLERYALQGVSLSQLVREQYFLEPEGGQQSFEVCSPPSAVAQHLGAHCPSAVLVVSRTLDFGAARAAVFGKMYCRTDRFRFSQQLGASR